MSKKPRPDNTPEKKESEAAGPQGTMFIRMTDLQGREEPAKLTAGFSSDAVLVGISEPCRGEHFKLKTDRITVGSKADAGNDIVISESTVSFMHARLIREQGQWRILNILSTNGTFVNGRKIIEAPVRHGDRVRFGAVEFVFQDSADDPAHGVGPGDQEPSTPPRRLPEYNLWWFALVIVVAALTLLLFALA